MSLAPGTRIGPYEVISMVGAGGMGQVFRARDTRLKRDVALKVLPDSVANAGVSALVMELVEGDGLSQRIAREPLPIEIPVRGLW